MKQVNTKDINNVINVETNVNLSALVGYEYGVELYDKKVKDKIVKHTKNIIIFPEKIKVISESFKNGFINRLLYDENASYVEFDNKELQEIYITPNSFVSFKIESKKIIKELVED